MSNTTARKETLVKARKAGRIVGSFIVFAGAILLLYGILTTYLPTVLNGAVLIAASILPFVVSKVAEKKLNDLGI